MKGTVLVVDDLPIIRDPIALTLAAAGFEALSAGDGKQALAMVRSHEIGLILLDVNMPVMDGLAFLQQIRGDPLTASIPVIMLSGDEDREHITRAANLGIQGYILKSRLSFKDILSRVTHHFSGTATQYRPIASPHSGASSMPATSQPTDA